MAQPIPAATNSSSISIPAVVLPTPPQSPHSKVSPRTSLTGVQSSFSRNDSPKIKSILKSTASSPRSETSSPSPKSVSSSKENSPRLKISSYPEVDRLATATEAERLDHLQRIYTVFERTKETLQKLKNQMLIMIDLHQEDIFDVFKLATNADSATLQKPYENLIRAKAQFLRVFNPWEKLVINPGQTPQEQNVIRSRVLRGLRRIAKSEDISENEDPKLKEILEKTVCLEYVQHFLIFNTQLVPLCQKYGINFIARLKKYNFLKGDEDRDTISDWISYHVLKEIQEYHQPALEQLDEEKLDALHSQIVDQKDHDILRNLVENFGKERSLIVDYNRIIVSFYVRNTQITSLFMKSSLKDKITKIQISALWQLSQLTRFVHRLDRYLQNEKFVGEVKAEKIQSFLKLNVTKCFKIFARAIEFGKNCEQLYSSLRMLSDLSSWSGYTEMQARVSTDLIHYLDTQGFLTQKEAHLQESQSCARSSTFP